ncbi:MAG TPA: hypothetical protein VHZ24_19450 [Pirellulales bacterium]|jgi:hypothetical protein|nr:hypothetical protein [Pirellulales bacterium]
MTRRICIVYDCDGDWAAAWRAVVEPATVVEAHSAGECRQALAEHPAAWVAIEVPGAADMTAALDLLAEVERGFPQAAAIAIVAPALRDAAELPLRECGARHVMSSRYELLAVATAARRHWARLGDNLVSDSPPSLREQILDRLPWGDSSGKNAVADDLS